MPDLAGQVSIVAREIIYEVASIVFFEINSAGKERNKK